ncbi:MAG: NADH-quinone oxidoreductase subunit A [Candidatus Bathyarchaeia archaeon]|nr:NADH-quinone oxidoreductase subunit A [Candidatus Bathyarchaeota archaeon]
MACKTPIILVALAALAELALAFIVVILCSLLIYVIGWLLAPKSGKSEEKKLPYACGERTILRKINPGVNLYKFLIYFAMLDSSVLMVAFAAIHAFATEILPYLALYLVMVLLAVLLIFEGRKK